MNRGSNDIINLFPQELSRFLEEMIEINKKNQTTGIDSVAVSITGHAGLGKTSIVSQVAKNKGMKFIKQNLAQLQEVGDLTGFPQKEFLMSKPTTASSKETMFVVEPMIETFKSEGWSLTNTVRMGYATPEWLPLDGQPVILLLDDYTRALPSILQASMEIVEKMEYVSWRLPKGSSVILTCNPSDDADYFGVNDIGVAMKTRFIEVGIRFHKEHWALWAEKAKVDTRCIDFLLYHPELVENKMTNPRIFEKFFRIIGQKPDWTKEGAFIATVGAASIGNTATAAFDSFVKKGLDKLPTPEEIMDMPINALPAKIKSSVMANTGAIKEDVVNIMMVRLANFLLTRYEHKKFDGHGMDRLTALQDLEKGGLALIGSDNWAFVIHKLVNTSDNFYGLAVGTNLVQELELEKEA